MTDMNVPQRLLVIDIDGLRQDVFQAALSAGDLPHLDRLLGGAEAVAGLHLNPVCPAPSITFTSQTTIFTGVMPEVHGIVGNQFFDRFGERNQGKPRFYAFDIGDTLAVDDAVLVFSGKKGLLNETIAPSVSTLYEIAGSNGMRSAVVHHMISRGAHIWVKPNLADIARFTKGGGLFGIEAEQFDGKMLNNALKLLQEGLEPDVLTVYFMGVDHQSHEHGPAAQGPYLRKVDEMIGELALNLEQRNLLDGTLVVVVSDHGQIEVQPDDKHSLHLGFPFDREMGYLFDELGLDVHDFPGEDPGCDAVLALNGGLVHVYLQHAEKHWHDAPRFSEDVLRTAKAFWEANDSGLHAPELQNALSAVLVRDVEHEGWQSDYVAYTPQKLYPLGEYLAMCPRLETIHAEARLKALSSHFSGDILLVSNYAEKYYFGSEITGIHGGLHPDDSQAVLSMGWVGANQEQLARLRTTAAEVLNTRTGCPSQDYVGLEDMLPILKGVFNWR